MPSTHASPSRSAFIASLVAGTGAERTVIPLDSFPFTLGRGADRSHPIVDPLVSRNHAFVDRDADGFFLRDTGSRHGTFVNGIRLAGTTMRLRTGDQIGLGHLRTPFTFQSPEEESTTRSLIAQFVDQNSASTDLETLSLFLKAAQSLNSFGAVDDVLRTMLEYTIRLTHAERGFVFLGFDPEALTLGRGQDEHGSNLSLEDATISHSMIRDATTSRLDFIVGDVVAEGTGQERESLVLNEIRSVVVIPLRGQHSDRLLGVLYLDSRSGAQAFSRTDREMLLVIARQAATLLENLHMLEAEREAVLMRKELEIAATIQRQIIPETFPTFPLVRLEARSLPCAEVGGDFYDVIAVPGGFVAIVGDVCGKGVPAALLASMVQGMVHAQITSGTGLVETITSLNSFVCARTPREKYVTLAILKYTLAGPGQGEIEVINGGHLCPVVVRANGLLETLADGDMPVGLLDFATFHSVSHTMQPGDRIVLLSDGISEAENADGIQFCAHALQQALVTHDPVAAIFDRLDEFCHGAHAQDDQTILSIERLA